MKLDREEAKGLCVFFFSFLEISQFFSFISYVIECKKTDDTTMKAKVNVQGSILLIKGIVYGETAMKVLRKRQSGKGRKLRKTCINKWTVLNLRRHRWQHISETSVNFCKWWELTKSKGYATFRNMEWKGVLKRVRENRTILEIVENKKKETV